MSSGLMKLLMQISKVIADALTVQLAEGMGDWMSGQHHLLIFKGQERCPPLQRDRRSTSAGKQQL